jgi:hypothetical protein
MAVSTPAAEDSRDEHVYDGFSKSSQDCPDLLTVAVSREYDSQRFDPSSAFRVRVSSSLIDLPKWQRVGSLALHPVARTN